MEQAARNNAIWCDTVCRAHGAPGKFYDAAWLNRHPVPRFYSNAITLSDQTDAVAQLTHIQSLIGSGLPGSWSVKDSFRALDLTDLGFQVLFEATWLWRAPTPIAPRGTDTTIRWTRVRSAPELAHWETAWSSEPANISPTPQPRLFLPALLADQNLVFIAAYRDEAIIAGAIANRTGGIVGLSNVFTPATDSDLFWAGCISAIQERFPGCPVVGYQRGPALAAAQTVGFEKLQDLRVWFQVVATM